MLCDELIFFFYVENLTGYTETSINHFVKKTPQNNIIPTAVK